jgi:ribosomal protein L37AE/L43A
MDEGITTEDLIQFGLYVVVGIAVVSFALWRIIKMQKAAKAPISDDACVVCGSRDLEKNGPAIYTCRACGYSGGSGQRQAHEKRVQEQLGKMTPEERKRSGLEDLRHARLILESAMSLVRLPNPSVKDVERVRGELFEAEQLMKLAGLKLGALLLPQERDSFDGGAFALSTAAGAGGALAAGLAAAAESQALGSRAGGLMGVVKAALDRHGGPGDAAAS